MISLITIILITHNCNNDRIMQWQMIYSVWDNILVLNLFFASNITKTELNVREFTRIQGGDKMVILAALKPVFISYFGQFILFCYSVLLVTHQTLYQINTHLTDRTVWCNQQCMLQHVQGSVPYIPLDRNTGRHRTLSLLMICFRLNTVKCAEE